MNRNEWRAKLDKAMNSISYFCSAERITEWDYIFTYSPVEQNSDEPDIKISVEAKNINTKGE